MRELAQADPAEPELPIDRTRASTPIAARIRAHLVLRLTLLFDDERLLGHQCSFKCSCPASGTRKASPARTQGASISEEWAMHIKPLAPSAADKVADWDVVDLHGLLEQAVEDEATVAGAAAVEPERELVQVVVEVLAAGGALVGAE